MIALEAGTALRITGACLFAFGLLTLAAGLRLRWQHPPRWVIAYRGRGSAGLGMIFGGAWLMSFIAVPLDGVGPEAVTVWLTRIGLVCVVAFAVTSWVWYPRRLCPLWYQRARDAGVDVTSPEAVESFRRLPPARQRDLATRRGSPG